MELGKKSPYEPDHIPDFFGNGLHHRSFMHHVENEERDILKWRSIVHLPK